MTCAPIRGQQPPEPAASVAPVTSPTPQPGKGLTWLLGDTTLKIGGYIKLDVIHDFDEIGSTDSFDPRTIPTDGSEGTNTRIHARQTRLNLDVTRPTDIAPMRFFIEGDFFGDNSAFRLRHAYATMGPLLAGQTWTNFMDDDAMPETLDFESPIGFPQIRQAQVRYTKKLESGDEYSFSIEDPASKIIPPTGVTGEQEEPLPDFTGHYTMGFSRGHVQLGAFTGMADFRPDVGSNDSVMIWGLNLSTVIDTVGKDNAIVQLTYGDGVGRYRGGVTAAPDANGDLEAVTTTAVLGSYQHFWSDKFRSTILYSWGEGDLPAGTPPTNTERVHYGAANLIYQFANRAWTGIEYLYGQNETFDGNSGHANRVQISFRFDL